MLSPETLLSLTSKSWQILYCSHECPAATQNNRFVSVCEGGAHRYDAVYRRLFTVGRTTRRLYMH